MCTQQNVSIPLLSSVLLAIAIYHIMLEIRKIFFIKHIKINAVQRLPKVTKTIKKLDKKLQHSETHTYLHVYPYIYVPMFSLYQYFGEHGYTYDIDFVLILRYLTITKSLIIM